MRPDKFDWANAYQNRSIVKIRTALGNTVIGRLTGYLVFTKLVGAYAENSVTIKGVAAHNPGKLIHYQCVPLSIQYKEVPDGR